MGQSPHPAGVCDLFVLIPSEARAALANPGVSAAVDRMKLLIVIVSYRVTDLTIDCLRSLSGEIDRVPGRGSRCVRTGPVATRPIDSDGPSTKTAGARGWT